MKAYYHVPNGSTYICITKVKYQGPTYFRATVRWYSKPGMTFLREDRNLKILNSARKIWHKIEL
jgi:hypothetical protein